MKLKTLWVVLMYIGFLEDLYTRLDDLVKNINYTRL